ncbi:pyridoxal 5'-phosphate synthase glutaminase subunit PdxT [Vallitalea guaymasensis]|uniref:pyridoxal 5'-phosphate synthase glutaminase subunit PdxT n=1 Tax=Vallitalea guaymasensis TaxID=1185412 RepID=UPI00272A3012|nr:pyridoxal 5'-phosphate synthase glutaminase subunit PdxT [Vallitalea guaymasensis]
MRIGVLALQGAYIEHINKLGKLDIETKEIRYSRDLNDIDGIIIPGGESTSIGKLLNESNIKAKIYEVINNGLPVWGTCAGMIILAKKIHDSNKTYIPLMDIEVVKNAYGRQLSSFTTNQKIKGLQNGFYPMVFIRAPYIKTSQNNVETLSIVDEKIVAAKQSNILVTSFHPELTDDLRMHQYFINMINNE